MASIGFDKFSVCDIQSLIDEHRDGFKEADYLKICNAMKYLYEHAPNDPQTNQSVDDSDSDSDSIYDAETESDSDSGSDSENQNVQRRYELETLHSQIINYQNIIWNAEERPRPVCNSHRQQVIEDLLQLNFRGPRGGKQTLTRSVIKQIIPLLVQRGLLLNSTHLEMLALAKRDALIQQEITRHRASINECLRRRSELIQELHLVDNLI